MGKTTKRLMKEGYQETAEEHLKWAKQVFPLAQKIWLRWIKNDTSVDVSSASGKE